MKLPTHHVAVALLTLAPLAQVPFAVAGDPFADYVRTTDPLSPADELKSFHLPPGFEIQLVASDPDIGKPMNLAFDAKGRLWVTSTHEYPFPAKPGEPKKDTIKVIELGPNGRATKITTFADQLDIPVGIYPIGDGSKVIAFDINNVCLHTDTDGDGKSDKREVLYPGWGYKDDTHGMASNFRRGFDGWLYGCHGVVNTSDVKGSDGRVMHLRSGNTYRMRLDGSHIEAFTIGQINPFGMCIDPLGNIYTSDSHSKPIYQNLRGGRYEAFDRNTDDGLGLAPRMMEHLHGSTAIAGSQFYAADLFPEEFRGNVFTGNVMTCRINRDKLEQHGSTLKAIEQPDFLGTDDPWFRPVNTVMGPDGALYVADFYNRIIGHYEVNLDHPGRDYERGRIWRIHYKSPEPGKFDISKADAQELIAKLNDPNLLVRMLATDQLSDRLGKEAVAPVAAMLESGKASPTQKAHGTWTLNRLGALRRDQLQRAAGDADPLVRVHAMRIVAETPTDGDLALKGLADADALVRRCAADALGQHPDVANVRPLLDAFAAADRQDTHLRYVLRMALRNQLKAEGSYAGLGSLSDGDVRAIADVSLAVESSAASTFLLDHIAQLGTDKDALTRYLLHAVRFSSSPNVAPLAVLMRQKFADDVDLQLDLCQSIRQGLDQRGQAIPDSVRQWAETLVADALRQDLPMPKVAPPALQQRLRTAAELAGVMKIATAAPELHRALLDKSNETDTRSGMAGSLALLHADSAVPALQQIVIDPEQAMVLRDRCAGALGLMATPNAQAAIIDSFRLVQRELQAALANALASNTASAEALLDAVAAGKAPALLLLELGIYDRLAAAKVPDLEPRVKKLTQGVAAPKEELDKLIADRRTAFPAAHPTADAGQLVFATNCLACHQVDGKGGAVGPNLAGLSKRGIDRLVEDVLDPNRNVDPAFRYSTLILTDGRLITGLQKREDGAVLVFADTTGKEAAIRKTDIRTRIESPSSLMPSNFAEIITPEDFNNLMAYLLSK